MNPEFLCLTGPSLFTPQCISMIENGLDTNVHYLIHNRMDHVEYWLNRCSGVVIAGGVDMHPTLYDRNIEKDQALTAFDFPRDVRELMIIDYCFKNRKPILAICRGHQLLAVYKGLGEDFIMDLDGAIMHQPAKYNVKLTNNDVCHRIEFLEEEFVVEDQKERKELKTVLKKETKRNLAWVNSWHHQGVKFVDKGKYFKYNIKILAICPTGMADKSNVIEMMRGTNHESFWFSTQFHPEADWEINSTSGQVIELFKEMLKG